MTPLDAGAAPSSTKTLADPRALVEQVFAAPATPLRAFRVASVLFQCGAPEEAYAVLVHGLSLESDETLTTEMVVESMPHAVLLGLAGVAEARGEHDVAGILESVAVVSAGS